MQLNTEFQLGQQVKLVRHPEVKPGLIIGVFADRRGHQFLVEYVTTQGEVRSNYFEEQDIDEG